MPARKPKTEEKPQFERFIETSRKVDASDTDEALERAISKIVQPKRPKADTRKQNRKASTA